MDFINMLLPKVYEHLNLPDKTYLGTRIAKKQLVENSQLSSSDKKAVQEDIEAIIWQNTLKNTTINISPYQESIQDKTQVKDDNNNDTLEFESYVLEYSEIAVIVVTIRTTVRAKKIAELIQRAIPYPLLVVLNYLGTDQNNKAESEPSVMLNLATKRLSKADHSKLKVERFYQSSFISLSHLADDSIESRFLKALAIEKQSFVNFYEFYMGWVSQFLELEKSKHTNKFSERGNQSVNITQAKVQAQLLDSIALLESNMDGIRQKIKQEVQINCKVELNIQAQKIKNKILMLKRELEVIS